MINMWWNESPNSLHQCHQRCLRNVMRRVGALSADQGRCELATKQTGEGNRDKQIDQIVRHGSFPISYCTGISSGVVHDSHTGGIGGDGGK